MPNFSTFNNGATGSSVRTTLNNVINFVNTGITLNEVLTQGNTTGNNNINIANGYYISGATNNKIRFTENTVLSNTYGTVTNTITNGIGNNQIISTDNSTTTTISTTESALNFSVTDNTSSDFGFYSDFTILSISVGDYNYSALDYTQFDINSTSITMLGIPSYDDDTDAGLGGLFTGQLYKTTGGGASPLNVAGILMIKQ